MYLDKFSRITDSIDVFKWNFSVFMLQFFPYLYEVKYVDDFNIKLYFTCKLGKILHRSFSSNLNVIRNQMKRTSQNENLGCM